MRRCGPSEHGAVQDERTCAWAAPSRGSRTLFTLTRLPALPMSVATVLVVLCLVVACAVRVLSPSAASSASRGSGAPEACQDARLQLDAETQQRVRRLIPRVPGHPRVYVRPADLGLIREKIDRAQFRRAWADVIEAARHPDIGYVFDGLIYLVKQDRDAGRRAMTGALRALKSSPVDTLDFGHPFHLAALAYDWTYDLLTEADKRAFVAEFRRVAAVDPDGPCYPAAPNAPGIVGHVVTGPLLTGQLPAGLAIYDEDATMFDAAATTFFNTFKPVRDFYYAGHTPHAGDSYGPRYVLHDLAASWLFRRMGAADVLSREQRFVLYRMIYDLRPDGQQLRRGDTADDAGQHPVKALAAQLAAYYYDDPYLFEVGTSKTFRSAAPLSSLFALLFQSRELRPRPVAELPLTKYFPEPAGTLVARTGWTLGDATHDALVSMHIGQYFFGNHQHVGDFGTFQVYYRGPLAIASGLYDGDRYGDEHWRNYYHQTISKNGLLIFDPSEVRLHQGRPMANDGGTRWPNNGIDHPPWLSYLTSRGYRMGKVVAVQFGPDRRTPDYSYIAGDITEAYTDKVARVTRSMVTFNNHSAVYPATLVVFDRIRSRAAEFKKTWLLHSIHEPSISGQTIVVTNSDGRYRGRLVAESLLPERATRTKVGGPGREWWIEATRTNYMAPRKPPPAEPGAWRVEVSPADSALNDLFLHVMTVMDAGTATAPSVERIDGAAVVGARFLDRAVLFGRTGELLRTTRFAVSGTGPVTMLVCDLQPGTWSVMRDGAFVSAPTVTTEGKCLSTAAARGRYELRLN
jgi:Heparinase II C-terminal domain